MANVMRQLQAIAGKTNKNATQLVRETNVQLFTSIIIKTPVDKGRLISGWVAQNNTMPKNTPEAVDQSGGIAIEAAKVVNGRFDIGDTYWFVNLVPYATYVENGTARQRAQGMVKMSIRDIQGIVNEQYRKLR